MPLRSRYCGQPGAYAVPRAVIEDEDHGLWVLEALFPDSDEHKLLISKTLAYLRGEGIKTVHPYLSNKDNASLIRYENEHWQIRPYVEGTPSPRPSWRYGLPGFPTGRADGTEKWWTSKWLTSTCPSTTAAT